MSKLFSCDYDHLEGFGEQQEKMMDWYFEEY